jgi:hypothetical protein
MEHKELDSIFSKIDDCDFEGAKGEMYSLSKDLAVIGNLEYSDFLADYAYHSSHVIGNTEQTKPRSEIDKKLETINVKIDKLLDRQHEIYTDTYEYFKEYENIATTTNSNRLRFSWFRLENQDNFPFIDDFMKGKEQKHIQDENILQVFINQLGFYGWLKKAGQMSILHLGARLTNIRAGMFWKFVELRKMSKTRKSALDEIPIIEDNIQKLAKEAEELRSHYWINDHSSTAFKRDFMECLEAFHKTQQTSPTSPPANATRF